MGTRTNGIRSAVVVTGCVVTLWIVGCGGIVDKDARALFVQRIGGTTMTVFPAFVRRGKTSSHDEGSAARIGQSLSAGAIAEVTLSDLEVPVTGGWHMNQAKMLRESAADFSTFIREHPIETEYALLTEYLIGGGGVGGVHCYILDATGTTAWASLWNAHHRSFAEANLKTPADCTALLCRELPQGLTRAATGDER